MDSGSITCLTTVMVLFSALMAYIARRRIETRIREQQKTVRVAQARDYEERRGSILEMLKWVHRVHEAVFFAEAFSHHAVSLGKMDASGWQEVAEKIDGISTRPAQQRFLPEALRRAAFPMETKVGELRTLITRHRESLRLMAYGRPDLPAPSKADLEAAQCALAQDLEDRARQFNVWVVALEKQLEEAWWETLP